MDAIPEFRPDILLSIRPRYASMILDGRKTVELRRRFPDLGTAGARALIYSSSPVRAIIASAQISLVTKLLVRKIWMDFGAAAGISKGEFKSYFAGVRSGYAIFFEDVRPLKPLIGAEELEKRFGIVPPQSYRYVAGNCIAPVQDEYVQGPHRHEGGDRAGRSSTRSVLPG